jgi:hypothetical protein
VSDFDDALAEVQQSFRSDREEYIRELLGETRRSVADLRDTEDTYRRVHAEYAAEADGTRAGRLLARQKADSDARVTASVGLGAWHRDRAQTFALAYLVERDVDDRRGRR